MHYLVVLLQGVFGVLVFTVPGLVLTALFCRRKAPEWPLALVLAVSFLLSSLLVAAWQWASLTLLGPVASRWGAWGLVLVVLACFGWKGRGLLSEAIGRAGIWERRSAVAVAGVVGLWLLLMPLSPYPGQLTVSLGDVFGYYRLAANLVAGRGWAPDYFVADLPGGAYLYLAIHPIPPLVTTLFLQVFGPNLDSLNVYSVLAAGGLFLLMASFAGLRSDGRVSQSKALFFVTLAACVVPAHFVFFGLGVHSAPGALAFLTLMALYVVRGARDTAGRLAMAATVAFLFLVRPEGAVLAALFVVICGGYSVLTARRVRLALRAGLVAAALAVLGIAWANLPRLMGAAGASSKALSVCYLKFDPSRGRFGFLYKSAEEAHHAIGRAYFGGGGVEALANEAIASELQERPALFLRCLAAHLVHYTSPVFLSAILFPGAEVDSVYAAAVFAMLVVLAAAGSGARILVLVILAFLLLLPLVNWFPVDRHMLTVSAGLLALCARSVAMRRWDALGRVLATPRARRGVRAACAGAFLLLAALDVGLLVRARTDRRNLCYAPILEDIRRVTSSGDVIASSNPPLITCLADRRSVGTAWLAEHLEGVVRKFAPDFIVVDNCFLWGPPNYAILRERSGLKIPGYELIENHEAEQYALFRKSRN
ncbi:MAG TPA: hypothetical protein VNE39_20695 [Planctomycetota bacterium]|nr:hypothetical protein [Planctomycetota bacterium]